MRFTCFVVLLSFSFLEANLYAIDLDQGFSGPSSSQAEFFSINSDKRMTIKVNFISGVNRPGIHHIPDNTNLMEAVSLAGGISVDADPSNVFVKRKMKDSFETLGYDLTDIVRDKKMGYPDLKNYDTIMIESRSKTTDHLLTGLSIIGSIIAIAAGYLIITKKDK